MDGLAIAASLKEIRAATEGGVVRSVHQPAKDVWILGVYAGEERRILVAPRNAAIHVTALTPENPPKPSPFVMLLRRHLRGGRVVAVRQEGWDRVVSFDVERREGRTTRSYELAAELVGVRGNLYLLERSKVLGLAHRSARNRVGAEFVPVPPQPKLDPGRASLDELAGLLDDDAAAESLARSIDGVGRATAADLLRMEAGAGPQAIQAALRTVVACVEAPIAHVIQVEGRATFYPLPPPAEPTATFGLALDAVSDVLSGSGEDGAGTMAGDLARAIARRRRTLDKLHAWWDAALEAERIRSLADLLMIHHREIAPKSKAVALVDPSTGREEAIPLVPSLDAIENAQRLYERAKRLRRGRPHVRSRIERLEREVRLIEEAARADAAGRPIDERALALVSQRPERARRGQAQSLLRVDEDGFAILVGRSALENDRLLRAAAPDDLWLHAKGFAGSHVIVRRGGRREIPEAVVRRAARLAAEHSKGRGERRVQVVVTEAKHVRKPKGGAPGLANVARGGTLTIEL